MTYSEARLSLHTGGHVRTLRALYGSHTKSRQYKEFGVRRSQVRVFRIRVFYPNYGRGQVFSRGRGQVFSRQ